MFAAVSSISAASRPHADRVDDLVERLVLADAGDRARVEQRLDLALLRRRGQRDDRDLGALRRARAA